MRISLKSVSQMIETLAKLGFLDRSEDAGDRRRKAINVTLKAKAFPDELKAIRSREFAAGAASLSDATRERLAAAIAQALREFDGLPHSPARERSARP